MQTKLAFENWFVRQLLHSALLVALPAVATRWPAEHCVCARQNVCPASIWNWPAMHAVQSAAFASLEKWPASQSSHCRSAVVLPWLTTRWPAAHCRRLSQNVAPFSTWNVPVAHGVQLAALVKAEYRPAEHVTQRSGVDSELFDSAVPGAHGCFESQYG